MKKKHIVVIIFLLFFSLAFIPTDTMFIDDFEQHISEAKLNRDYQVWENGALLKIFLEEEIVNSGSKSLGVRIVSPNPYNQAMTGSIFRSLELLQGNWSNASGLRFWFSNPGDTVLFISFNLKERFREYWAVADAGIFYLQDDDGVTSQQEIYYGSLSIPANFQGLVILPFDSLAVPDWNTARTNDVLDLHRIESYAFSVSVGEVNPHIFYIDDIEVFGETTFYTLNINGVSAIEVPSTGVLLQTYQAELGSIGSSNTQPVNVRWSIREPFDSRISLNDEGILQIPAELATAELSLIALYESSDFLLTNTFDVKLEGDQGTDVPETPAKEPANNSNEQLTDYDRFSAQFDTWATENRALFVIGLVFGLMVFLFILSSIQRKLK